MDYKSINIDPAVLFAAFQQNNTSFTDVMKSVNRSGNRYDEKNMNKLVDLFTDSTFVANIKIIINQLKNVDMDALSKSPVLKNTCKMINLESIDSKYGDSVNMVMKIYEVYGPMIFTMYSTVLSFIDMYVKTCDFDVKKLEKLQKVAKMVRGFVIDTGNVVESQETVFNSQNKTYLIIVLTAVILYLLYQRLFE